jgi:dihydroorotate dehydrogenase electron transfer subunit
LPVMQQITAEILWNASISPHYGRVALACGEEFVRAEAGQFVMLGLPSGGDPLLRRPFSIHRLAQAGGRSLGIELLYKIVGPTTSRLSRLAKGETVNLLGPLGNSFRIPSGCERIYLAAGGVGVAPLVFLVERLAKTHSGLSGCRLFLGGRSREDLLCVEDFERAGIPVRFTTDDGSFGDHCLVTHPLEVAVEQAPPDLLLACGPKGMLACIVGIARKHRLPCQVSIETMMACGMGACLGCAVAGHGRPDRFLHACIDGPVFEAAELEW